MPAWPVKLSAVARFCRLFAAVLPNPAAEFAGVSILSFFSTAKAIKVAQYASCGVRRNPRSAGRVPPEPARKNEMTESFTTHLKIGAAALLAMAAWQIGAAPASLAQVPPVLVPPPEPEAAAPTALTFPALTGPLAA